MRVATAARKKQLKKQAKKVAKKQAKTQRRSDAKSRGTTPVRNAKSRVSRATGVRRAKPVAKKAAAKKTLAKNRVTKKAATKKRAVVTAAKKRKTMKRVAKPAARKVARPVAPKKTVSKLLAPRQRAPKRPMAPVPPAFSAQRATADARGLLLFELARGRAAVKAAIQGLTGANALNPIAPGKWSIFEIVLHLSERDRVRLDEVDRTLGGEPRTWAGMHDPEMGAVNEAHLGPLRAHTWDEAVRRLDSLRDELLQRLSAVPSAPEHVWKAGHPFGDMMWGLPEHDRHHAMQIKNARIGGIAPLEA